MPVTVTLPQLGESVTEGTITRWLKSVGDTVAADEPLVEISTDKVDTEIPAPASGVLLSIAAEEDAVVEVGGVLGVIGEPSEAGQAAAPEPAPQPAAQEATPEPTPEPAPAAEPSAAPADRCTRCTAPAPATSAAPAPAQPKRSSSPSRHSARA